MIHTAEIIRMETGDEGTFGILRLSSQIFCNTLEPEDRVNRANESCIPPRQYTIRLAKSFLPSVLKYGGLTYEIVDVPDRCDIRFHPGNTEDDTLGCVILGQYIGKLRSGRAVLNSGDTFIKFMEAMENVELAKLVIKDFY